MDSNIFAKTLRKNSTLAEQKLWKYLRRKDTGFKFRRQQAIGPYIVDFYCAAKRLIIELDGGQHTTEKDGARTAFLEQNGATILRFWNHDVLQNTDGVYYMVMRALGHDDFLSPSPAQALPGHPLSQGERGSIGTFCS